MRATIHRTIGRGPSLAVLALGVAVGVVLADSAIVTLALPSILRELDVAVGTVAWVLIAFNVALAIAAVPAAWICLGGRARPLALIGVVAFAAASAICGVAGSIELLLAARVAQAIGGALVIAACLDLLVAASGSQTRGAALWAAAGVAGLGLGPVAGGLLTDLISWRAIFVVQVPLLLAVIPLIASAPAPQSPEPETVRAPADRPHITANLSLALLSAALAAALFLLVLLLVEGWRRSPALAALTVTVIPLAAWPAGTLARMAGAGTRAAAASGAILIAGGLVGLAIPPSASPLWTIAPQILIGLGLGLTIDSLTHAALAERIPHTLHGGWTIAARHAGVVAGLAILTPIFTADLRAAELPAKEAIAAQVLDARLTASSKLALAKGLGDELTAERGRVPDLGAAFARVRLAPGEAPEAARLRARLDDQLRRAATDAFRTAFLVAALIAALAVVPALFLGKSPGVLP